MNGNEGDRLQAEGVIMEMKVIDFRLKECEWRMKVVDFRLKECEWK